MIKVLFSYPSMQQIPAIELPGVPARGDDVWTPEGRFYAGSAIWVLPGTPTAVLDEPYARVFLHNTWPSR